MNFSVANKMLFMNTSVKCPAVEENTKVSEFSLVERQTKLQSKQL